MEKTEEEKWIETDIELSSAALSVPTATVTEANADDDDDDDWDNSAEDDSTEADDERVYKNPRNSPNSECPRDEEQATLLSQKCLRKCSSDEDCKSKKKKCLCDGACGMSCIKPGKDTPSDQVIVEMNNSHLSNRKGMSRVGKTERRQCELLESPVWESGHVCV